MDGGTSKNRWDESGRLRTTTSSNSVKDFLRRDDGNGLVINVGVAVGSALLANAIIWALDWNSGEDASKSPSFAPPGYIVGIVWVILFACMGAARWSIVRDAVSENGRSRGSRLLIVLVILCALFPFYSLAPDSNVAGLIGTLVTLAFAAFVTRTVRPLSRTAFNLMIPLMVWLLYATAIIVRTVQIA